MAVHTITIRVQDRPGVLARISELLAGHGCNINSLRVRPERRPGVSRMRIITSVDEERLGVLVSTMGGLQDVLEVRAAADRAATGYWLVAYGLFATILGLNLATPLYAIYREQWALSPAMVALLFAAYAFVVIPAIVCFGQLSDRSGPRAILAGGAAVSLTASICLATAGGVYALLAARALQGLAVGMFNGVAVAALTLLHPSADRHRAALLAAIAVTCGNALSPLLSGMLAEWAPYPLQLPYALHAVLMLPAVVGLLLLRLRAPASGKGRDGVAVSAQTACAEAVAVGANADSAGAAGAAKPGARDADDAGVAGQPPSAAGPGLTPPELGYIVEAAPATLRAATAPRSAGVLHWPRVPRAIRGPFYTASASSFIAWAAASLFMSLIPSYMNEWVGRASYVLAGITAAIVLGVSAVSQALLGRLPLWRMATVGFAFLLAGFGVLWTSMLFSSPLLLVCSALLVGLGHGPLYAGSLASVNALAPGEARGDMVSFFYVGTYLGVALPVLGLGYAAQQLTLLHAVELFLAALAGLSLLVWLRWRKYDEWRSPT